MTKFFSIINVLAFLKNMGILPVWLIEVIRHMSSALLVVAIAAIGVKTSLKQVLSVGWKPIILMATETVFLAGLVIAGIECFY